MSQSLKNLLKRYTEVKEGFELSKSISEPLYCIHLRIHPQGLPKPKTTDWVASPTTIHFLTVFGSKCKNKVLISLISLLYPLFCLQTVAFSFFFFHCIFTGLLLHR